MGTDRVEELSGYDEVDPDQVFNGGYLAGNKSPAGEGRRKGKKSLSRGSAYRARPKRTMGGVFKFRGFEDAAKAMLAASIGAMALCAVILYATFSAGIMADYKFYGALTASIVVMALLFYTASRLIGGREG